MTDVLFRFDVDVPPAQVLEAVKTSEGIRGFWTSRAEVPGEVGETLKLEFGVAPAPFDLRLEQSDESSVVWRTETFPPHRVAYTWGQIIVRLKEYSESGRANPVFT